MSARTPCRAALLALVLLALVSAGCLSGGTEPIRLPFELELAFEGNKSVDTARLDEIVRRQLEELELTAPDKAAVDDAAFALELFYRTRGRPEVRVDYELEPGPPPRAVFRISEGPEVRVRTLAIEGPAALEPSRVRKALEPVANGRVLDEQALAARIEALRELYRGEGYLHVAIDPPLVETVPDDAPSLALDDEGRLVDVTLVLREGPRFVVGSLDVHGGDAALADRERGFARSYVNEAYQPRLLPRLEHELSGAYQRAGHPDVRVRAQAELDETSGAVRLAAEVTPGERVTIAHFRIEGNTRTKDAAVLGFLGLEKGTTYDSERVREAFRALYATGLFESVVLELEGTGPERTLAVTLVEARSVQIRLEPGWGSYEGPRVLLGIEENNFQGRGQILALEGTASLRSKGARIGWIDRDFLGSSFTSETTFYVEQREEPSYEFLRRGAGFFVRRTWTDKWSSSVGYEYRPTDVTDDSFNVPLPPDLDSDSSVAALSTSATFDDRDNPLTPTRGSQANARLELADDGLGSDTEFLRAQLDLVHLFRIGKESQLVATARSGVIRPFGTTDVIPLPERFFNGGENSVRSYKEDELLPPGFDGEPQGGEAATTLNLEWRRQLADNLGLALFVDTGNVAPDAEDYLDFAGFRSGYGVGLRYLLPIGPVRLDLGINPDPEDDEDEMVLHFSVGFPF
jgi:outer membrane protein insertion porin family